MHFTTYIIQKLADQMFCGLWYDKTETRTPPLIWTLCLYITSELILPKRYFLGGNRFIDSFFHEISVSRDQSRKMLGTDSDQFPRSFYPSFDYSRHTSSCVSSICTMLRFNILYLYESLSLC